jgi:hypothetical protein
MFEEVVEERSEWSKREKVVPVERLKLLNF